MTSTSTSSTQKIQEDVQVSEVKPPVNKTIAQIRSLAAGAAGGVCAVVVGHPFDLVKVRLQTSQKGVYSGAMDVVRRTVAREGLVRVCIWSFLLQLIVSFCVLTSAGFVCRCLGAVGWCDAYV